MQKGCACSFLFGPDTTDAQKKQIEESLQDKAELKLEVCFYKSNGNNTLHSVSFRFFINYFLLFALVVFFFPFNSINPLRTLSCSGAPFWCLLDIVPIKNEKHEVVLFLASHKDVTKSKLADAEMTNEDNEDEDDDENEALGNDGCLASANYQRRRSRAVLYQLSGHYRKSVSMKSKLKLNNVSGTYY